MARLMVNRIVGVIGWIGTVLVFGAVAIRFLRPEWTQYAQWARGRASSAFSSTWLASSNT